MDYSKLMVVGLVVNSLGCPADEEGEAVADTGGTQDTSSVSGECPAGSGVVVSVGVESEVVTADREASPESGESSYDLTCTVDTLTDDDGTTSLALTCLGGPDQPDTSWSLALEGVPGGELAFGQGDEIRMLLSIDWGFEVGGGTTLRIEQEGAPVLLAYFEGTGGGTVGLCGPGEESSEGDAEAFFAPLGLVIERDTCDPIARLRLDFDVDGEAVSLYGGQQAMIGSSGWTVAAGEATCVSQEDDPEVTGADDWRFSVAAWEAGA